MLAHTSRSLARGLSCSLRYQQSHLLACCARPGAVLACRNKSSITGDLDEEALEVRRKPSAQANSLLDIGYREIFSPHHDQLRATARKFFVEDVKPQHKKWEEAGQVSREVWEAAGGLGLLGVTTPQSQGGPGGDYLTSALIMEEQAYANISGPGFPVHSAVVLPYISQHGAADQVEQFVPDMVAGRKIGSIAMTEPDAGSDLQGLRTTAKRDGDDWILNGAKTFITNGALCDVAVVVAVTSSQAKSGAHGLSLFVVDAHSKGFTKGKKQQKIGLIANDTCEFFFDNVRLPSSALLGEVNKGFHLIMQDIKNERLLIGVICSAFSEFIFEETREYIKQRRAFGRPLADMQVVRHKMAKLKTEICTNRAFTDQCIALQDQARLDTYMASMSKFCASELNCRVAHECLQLHGGNGYLTDFPVSRAFVDARVHPIYGGTSEIMLELIGRSVAA